MFDVNGEQIALALLGVTCAVLGWLARQLWDAVQKLREDLAKLQSDINRDFVSYDRLRDVMEPVLEALRDIKSSLNTKADKQ